MLDVPQLGRYKHRRARAAQRNSHLEVTVKRSSGPIRKLCAGAVALTVGVACLASPCRAEEPAGSGAAPHSIATLPSETLARLALQEQPQTSTADNASFFKTKKGAAVLVLLAAGFGYTLYSKSHDRVLSSIR
jgi:hypothetical protein